MRHVTIERAYGIAGLAIGLTICLVAVDLLTDGAVSAVFGRAPARLAAVPDQADEDGAA
jgi:hypothetical protein